MVTNVANTAKEASEEKFADVALALPGAVNIEGADGSTDAKKKKRKCKNASCGYICSLLLNLALIVVIGVLVHKVMRQKHEIRELKRDAEEYEVTPSAVVEKDDTVDLIIIMAGGFKDWVMKENGDLVNWYKNRHCRFFVRWYRYTTEDEGDDTLALPDDQRV